MAESHDHDHAPQWQRLAGDEGDESAPSPGPRSSHALVFVAPYVYLLAGELTPRVPVDDQGAVWRINLDDDAANAKKWERVPTTGAAPPPCIAPAAAAIGSSIYLFGGRTAVDMQQGTLGDVYKLDTTTNSWQTVWSRPADADAPDTPTAPAPRSYHAAASLNNKLFVFGGCGPSGRLNDLWAFDPEKRTWERMPDPPQASVPPRGGASLAALPEQRRMVVVGGFDGTHERADAHTFDVEQRKWCSGPQGCASCAGDAPTLPARSVLGVAAHTGCGGGAAAAEASSCAHGGHVVAFGGECDPSATRSHDTAGRFLGDVWCGDGQRGDWHPLATAPGGPSPGPRGWFASCAVPGGLVLHGGLDATNTRLSDCWRLRFGH